MKSKLISLIGNPVKSDKNSFIRKARMLQGWYRAFVLGLVQGIGPGEKENSRNKHRPNMIPKDTDENVPNHNFLNEEIRLYVKKRMDNKRIDETLEPYRLCYNMLSSQPLAFNLFVPLAIDKNLALATKVFRKIFPDKIKKVTKITFEFAPEPKEDYLDDRTAFDVFVEYLDISGTKSFIAIEVKYTETFSPKEYECKIYKDFTISENSPFRGSVNELKKSKFNQLWRNTLLAYSMLEHENKKYSNATIMLVYMKEDEGVNEIIPSFSSYLKNSDEWFQAVDIRELINLIKSCGLNLEQQKWIEDFSLRYLRFDMVV